MGRIKPKAADRTHGGGHKTKFWTVVLILAMLASLSLAVGVYINQLGHATDASVVASMEELSRHDMQNIKSELQSSWEELSAIYSRVVASRCDSIQEVCLRLNTEQLSNIFDVVYLVDSHGNTYSSANVVKNSSAEAYVKPLLSGEQKYVMRYDSMDILEAIREDLVYGIACEPFEMEGVRFIGVLGFSKISLMAERLKIDSFDGRGYTGIIDIDGNYVVNRDRSAGIGRMDNYFEQLQEQAGLTEKEVEDVIHRLKLGDEFIMHLEYMDHGEQVVSLIPMPETTWSIVLTVPQEVFNEQSQQFVFMTMIMLVAVVIVMCLMMFIIIRISLISATAKAEAKSRGEFLSNMSHEIRTPLNGIIGLNHLMQQNTENPERLKEYLRKSDSTAKYLLSLVSDILDMSKLQADKMVLILKPFSVTGLIATIESLMNSRMEDKSIDFCVEADITYPDLIGDEMRIEQILVNILGNAAKFTPDGGHVIMRVFQSAQEAQVTTTYEVVDDGCGMSEEFQKKIFDSFSQEHNNVSHGNQGTGLGMAISYLLAKQMGGMLSVQSHPDEGSCFTFTMTSDIAHEDPDTIATADTLQPETGGDKKLKVLIAEDNELNAEILIEILNAEGFCTVRACDGGEVVDIFESSAPYTFDIILMDVQMPVRNGFEAAKIIRAMDRPDAKTVRIYACTANTFKEDQDRSLEIGMNGFISKPIDVDKLMQLLGLKDKGEKK